MLSLEQRKSYFSFPVKFSVWVVCGSANLSLCEVSWLLCELVWESTLIITAVSDHASRCACVICQQLVREVNNHDRSLFLHLPASFSLTTPHYTGRVLRLWWELSFLPMSGRSPDTSERLISLCANCLTHSRFTHMDTWSVFSTLWHHGGLTPAWW